MFTKDERYKFRNTIDLTQWGFKKIDEYIYRNEFFFSVFIGEWCVMFSSKHITRRIEFDQLDIFLGDLGYEKKPKRKSQNRNKK